MNEIQLSFEPFADVRRVETRGNETSFLVVGTSPELAVVGFPTGLDQGLYRLEIETPDASKFLPGSIVLVEGAAGWRPRKAVLEMRQGMLHAYFSLPPGITGLRFAPAHSGHRWRVGPATMRRVSTTWWRARRASGGLTRRLAHPGVVGGDLQRTWEGIRKDGIGSVRRRFRDALNPASSVSAAELNVQTGSFAKEVAVRNKQALARFARRPDAVPASLSVIVPVYHSREAWFAQLLESFNRQTEQEFEVVLVFDGPQDALRTLAEAMMVGSYRRQVIVLPENKGVSGATNAGIRTATGDFIVVVDHDDALEHHFVEAFRSASARLAADIYFADEVLTDGEMRDVRVVATRGTFDIRFYLSHPYVVHPIFIRASLALAAGLLDETMRVSHDVEFFLRCLAKADSVVQIPLLLYFWRTHGESLGHKLIADVGSNTEKAIRAYLTAATDWPAIDVRGGVNFNEYDVRPPVPAGARAAVVIPTKNGKAILSKCLQSLYDRRSANATPADIHVIDHQSDDPETLAFLRSEKEAGRIEVVLYRGAWNFSAINNAALREILPNRGYSHIVFMNNDIELRTDDWLDRMMAQFSWGDVGVVGCCLEYPNGLVQHGGVVIGLSGPAEHSHKFEAMIHSHTGRRHPGHLSSLTATRDYSAVTAALMIVPTGLFEAVGGFDEKLAVGFNDTDLCLRIGALGFHSTYVGSVVAVHHESITRGVPGVDAHPADTALFQARYGEIIAEGDPFYGIWLDWSGSRIVTSLDPQKMFGLRETRLGSSSRRRGASKLQPAAPTGG